MVRLSIFLGAMAFIACGQPFVMKTKLNNSRPVMVGEVRQIGGAKIAPEPGQASPFSTEIEILDTPTASSQDWQTKQEYKLDSKLTAATLLGERDSQITELTFGSHVFNVVLFYFDKDWIRVSGYSVPRIFIEPERKYNLNPTPRRDKKNKRGEKVAKEKKKTKKSRRRPE